MQKIRDASGSWRDVANVKARVDGEYKVARQIFAMVEGSWLDTGYRPFDIVDNWPHNPNINVVFYFGSYYYARSPHTNSNGSQNGFFGIELVFSHATANSVDVEYMMYTSPDPNTTSSSSYQSLGLRFTVPAGSTSNVNVPLFIFPERTIGAICIMPTSYISPVSPYYLTLRLRRYI